MPTAEQQKKFDDAFKAWDAASEDYNCLMQAIYQCVPGAFERLDGAKSKLDSTCQAFEEASKPFRPKA